MNILHLITGLIVGKRLPITSGTIKTEGLSQPAVIHRDRYGIPYIKAQTEGDAFFTLGFCQGQDRSFQIERLTRITRGTLSEIIGSEGITVDRFSARAGFYLHAKRQVELLEPRDRQLIRAFSDGVNQGIRNGCRQPGPEFRLLQIDPTPHEAADVLAVLNFISFALSPWPNKISRFQILRGYGPDVVGALEGPYPDWIPATRPVGIPSGAAQEGMVEDLTQLAAAFGLGGGSNAWAVNSSRSKSGRPLLANDPHLGPSIPSPWYLAHLQTPQWSIAGGSLAGTPFFPIGHNGTVAWGVTGGSADNADLFVEELGEEENTVRDGEGFLPCQVIQHKIYIRGEDPFEDKFLVTPRGPIISDVLEGVDSTLSIRTTWMNPRPLSGLFDIYTVGNFQEFRQAWSDWYQATMNLVYADTADFIGWQLIGDIPQRGLSQNRVPVPGWDPRFQWENDRIPFNDMPHLSNPETHFLASANNKPTPGDDPYLGADFPDGYRLARILETLETRGDWDLAGMLILQMDQYSIPWREIREAVLNVPKLTAESREAIEILSAWDGHVTADSPAAAVYELFLSEMLHIIVKTQAPQTPDWVLGRHLNPLVYATLGKRQISLLSRYLREQPEGWFKNGWPEGIGAALTRAIRKLKEDFGSSRESWAWGKIRPLTLQHPFGAHWLLGKLFNRGPFPWGGDSQTIAQARRSLNKPYENPSGVANLRMVLEVGNWENNTFVLAGGQSGNPFSPHYDDQLTLWKRGEGVTIAWSEGSIQEITQSTLHLRPSGASGEREERISKE